MNVNYNRERAKNLLKKLYHKPDDATDIPSVLRLKVSETKLQTIKYPPSIRIMGLGKEEDELTVTLQGVLCGKALPPLTHKPSTKSVSHIRNLRQHVKITGLGLPEFASALETVSTLVKEFETHAPSRTVTVVDCVPYEGDASLEAHARYFTDRNLVPFAKNTPFSVDVDTHGILRAIQPDMFIHGPDNYVEYCKVQTTADGVKRVGDVVEIAFSFIGVPVKNGGYRIMLNLRALTLLDSEIREDSERAITRSIEGTQHPAPKRKRLYLQEEDAEESARPKTRQEVDTEEGGAEVEFPVGGDETHKMDVE